MTIRHVLMIMLVVLCVNLGGIPQARAQWAVVDVGAMNQGVGANPSLSSQVRSSLDANAVLTPQQLARLSPQERNALESQRRVLATRQALTREALQNTSARFSELQELVSAIGSAEDPKAVMDLQARIAAEQVMRAKAAGPAATTELQFLS